MTDPIADMLTRVRNAQRAQKKTVVVPYSRTKEAILKVFADEGYVGEVTAEGEGASRQLRVTLKYFQGQGVIENLVRISRPGLRIYRGKDDLPKINAGLGVAIVSTPKGVMTDRAARALGQGGEVLCKIY
ncbi:30S ribosomal protein S8 [Thioalkalivibrio paradoxus ARh 1]|uniref:Small ribosomal subunit protein uS8 n=2 Tax=Thioalkalivibrio paradoxus TaxID=108010 RepID=W0DLB4_9GAMM|nr:30S ribosomal protein S8 [Thioalkalivibrio paradoxus ARh 1]